MILESVMWKGNKTSVFSISFATCRGFRFMPRIELQDLHSECDERSKLLIDMRVCQDRDSCSKNDPDFSPITSAPAVEEGSHSFIR